MNYEERPKVVHGISKLQEDKWLKCELVYQHFSTTVGDVMKQRVIMTRGIRLLIKK